MGNLSFFVTILSLNKQTLFSYIDKGKLHNVLQYVVMFRYVQLWQYGLSSFQVGGTKLERFLPKNQHTQRSFENWVNGEVSKIGHQFIK